jgi:hypothetical protein
MMTRQSVIPLILVAGLLGCGGRGSDSGGPDDAGVTDGHDDDSLTPADGSPTQEDSGATPGVVPCGQTTCDITTQQCCITVGQSGGATCIDATAQCQGVPVSCDGPEDCSGGAPICCGSVGNGGVVCAATCQGLRLCRLDADCDSGNRCCGSGSVGGTQATWCVAPAQCSSTNPTVGVPCANTTCNSPEVCCVVVGGQSCTAADACTSGLPLACDGPEDCSGDTPVCCGTVSLQGGGTQCVADGSCQSGTLTGGVVCHSDSDCQSGQTCTALTMTSVRVCR